MCLSAEVDLAVGGMVGVVGIDALRHVRRPRELPLAAVPLVLGTHLFVEAFVWLGLQGRVGPEIADPARWTYLAGALVVVPALIPVAIILVEPPARRRQLWGFAALGAAVAAWLGVRLVQGPARARLEHLHIAYFVDVPDAEVAGVAYVIATCGPALLSSRAAVRRFGLANLIVVLGLAALLMNGVVSLWCAWAAVTSVAVDGHLRAARGEARRTFAFARR